MVVSVLLLISTHSSSAYSNSNSDAFVGRGRGRGRGQCSQPNRHRPILTKNRINFTPTLSSRKTRTTTCSSTTTSLRGIDYEAIENSSTTNADEYSDFDISTIVQLQLLPTSNDLLTPKEIVSICMSYLQRNSKSSQQAVEEQQAEAQQHHQQPGLEICYNFSSDSCRMANGGSLESFLQHANNPVFQCM